MEFNIQCRRAYEAHVQGEQAQIKALQVNSEMLSQENEALQLDLQVQRASYTLVISDMGRICNDKHRVLEERDTARFEMDLSELILDQYRDETRRKEQSISAKQVEIEHLTKKLIIVETEVSTVRNQCGHHDGCAGKVPTKMVAKVHGEQRLSAPVTRERPKKRKCNGMARKGQPDLLR